MQRVDRNHDWTTVKNQLNIEDEVGNNGTSNNDFISVDNIMGDITKVTQSVKNINGKGAHMRRVLSRKASREEEGKQLQ